MNRITEILIKRDNLTEDQALDVINEAVEAVDHGVDIKDVMYNYFGLEPDYLFDFMEFLA